MDPFPTQPPDEVSIRCPGCGQRFTVGHELVGRVVECGSCDRRFRVEEDVMLRQRKFYPGERRDPSLEHFGRVPMRSSPLPPGFETASYTREAPPASAVEPPSPLRIVLGIFAGLLLLVVGLILVFGGRPGGILDGAPMGDRLMLASFTAVLALLMLVFANPRNRLKGGLVAAAFGAGLIALPFFFREGSEPATGGAEVVDAGTGNAGGSPRDSDVHAAIKEEMVYEPLARALESYGPEGSQGGRTAVGIWLRNLRYFNRDQVVDFLVRRTGASEPGAGQDGSWLYPRDEAKGDFLLVLRDVEPGLSRVATLCGRFGRVERVIDDLSVVEVTVDNGAFVAADLAKLQDTSSPDFYSLNKRELDSIELDRVKAAVIRLGGAEPKVYRDDIVRRLHELLAEGDTEMKREVAKTLAVWAAEGDGSVKAVRDAAAGLLEHGQEVPSTVIAFLVGARDAESLPVIHELWKRDSTEWEAIYGDFGSAIEPQVLEALPGAAPLLKLSAVRLLGRVGGPRSLSALRAERQGAPSELAVGIDQAIEAIERRP